MSTTAAQQPQPVIIGSGGGSGVGTALIVLGLAAGAYYVIDKKVSDKRKNAAEEEMDTPAGAIALQLKTVFDAWPNVNARDYRNAMLQVTPALKDDVYRLYRLSTGGRNLSDDIATKVPAGTQNTVAKQEKINATTSGIIKITPDDKIEFLVSKNSLVRFEPGSKTPIPLYLSPSGIATASSPTYLLQPSAMNFKVWDVKEVAYTGLKATENWQKFFRPYVKTRKVYAAVQIVLPMINQATGKKTHVTLWGDARLFRIGKGTNFLKGIGCACKNNLGLIS